MTTDHTTAEAIDHRRRVQDHRAAKVAEYATNSSEKDKIVVSISSAALAFTLAFVDTGAGDATALYIAWIAFALSVIAVILSFDLNAHQLRRTIQFIDSWERDPKGQPEPANGVLTLRLVSKEWRGLAVVNSASVYLLLIGIVATVIHVWSVS